MKKIFVEADSTRGSYDFRTTYIVNDEEIECREVQDKKYAK